MRSAPLIVLLGQFELPFLWKYAKLLVVQYQRAQIKDRKVQVGSLIVIKFKHIFYRTANYRDYLFI